MRARSASRPVARPVGGPVELAVSGLGIDDRFGHALVEDVSFSVRRGEVLELRIRLATCRNTTGWWHFRTGFEEGIGIGIYADLTVLINGQPRDATAGMVQSG